MEERHTISSVERPTGGVGRGVDFSLSSAKCAGTLEENYLMKVTRVTLREAAEEFLLKGRKKESEFFLSKSQRQSKTKMG